MKKTKIASITGGQYTCSISNMIKNKRVAYLKGEKIQTEIEFGTSMHNLGRKNCLWALRCGYRVNLVDYCY